MKYTEITLNEMVEFLGYGWIESATAGTREYVYEWHLNEEVVIKVYTSIHKDTSVGRRCGQDAIRVCAVNTAKNIGWIRSTRVLRVEGWKNNLHRAIASVIHQATDRCHKAERARAARQAYQTVVTYQEIVTNNDMPF